MTTARRDEACPYEWAEFNVPQELRAAAKSVSPFARLVFEAGQSHGPATDAGLVDSDTRSRLGSLLLPTLGIPLPKL
jgi:hypothetical protein